MEKTLPSRLYPDMMGIHPSPRATPWTLEQKQLDIAGAPVLANEVLGLINGLLLSIQAIVLLRVPIIKVRSENGFGFGFQPRGNISCVSSPLSKIRPFLLQFDLSHSRPLFRRPKGLYRPISIAVVHVNKSISIRCLVMLAVMSPYICFTGNWIKNACRPSRSTSLQVFSGTKSQARGSHFNPALDDVLGSMTRNRVPICLGTRKPIELKVFYVSGILVFEVQSDKNCGHGLGCFHSEPLLQNHPRFFLYHYKLSLLKKNGFEHGRLFKSELAAERRIMCMAEGAK